MLGPLFTNDFGNVQTGTTTSTVTFTLNNTGAGAATSCSAPVLNGANPSQFVLSSDTCGTADLAASGSCSIAIAASPSTVGTKTATLSRTCTVGGTVTTTSNAITVVGDTPSLAWTPLTNAFGNVQIGTSSSTQTFTLTNSSGVTATGCGAPSLAGANPSEFVLSGNTCGATLAAGATCTVNVAGSPTTIGTKTATLSQTCTLGGTNTTTANAITVVGINPSLAWSPLSNAFGTVQIGTTSATQTFTLTNSGGAPATGCSAPTLSGTNPSEFTLTGNTCGATIAASGGTCTINVAASPTVVGLRTATLTQTCTVGGITTTTTDAITVTGGNPSLAWSPLSNAFGNVNTGTTSATQTFTLTNSGATSATSCSAPTLTGANPTEFTLSSNTCGATIAASGGSCTVAVAASPTVVGSRTATLSQTCTVGGTTTTTANAITVTGTAPVMAWAPLSNSFGNVLVGSSSSTQTFTLTNSGTGAATGCSAPVLTGANPTEFTLSSNTCGATVAASGGTCTIAVAGSPTSTGTKTATLSQTCTVGGTTTTTANALTVTGTGPALALSPLSNSFGSVLVGSLSSDATFTISNSGTANATGCSAPTLGGANPTHFTLVGTTCGSSIAAGGGSCTVTVDGSPTTTGAKTATLSMTCTVGGTISTTSNAITVNGVSPSLAWNPLSNAFGSVIVGQTSSAMTFTLSNSGTADATGCGTPSLAGANPGEFALSNNNCGSVTTLTAGGGNCTVDVAARPTSAGTKTATLTQTCTVGGTTTTTANSITVTSVDPPLTLSYSTNPATYLRGVLITQNTVSYTGGAPTSYSVSPPLPSGLTLNTSTGAITGTATALSGATDYVITGSNVYGSAQVTVNIGVVTAPPANLAYLVNPATYSIGVAILNNTPTSTGDPVISYSISPSLPAGLNFDTSTGIISGTPSSASGAQNYLVTATNAGGSGTVNVNITVTNLPPSIASIFPTGGPKSGGTFVTIIGQNYLSGATVTIGGSTCTGVTFVSGTQLTCTTGSNATEGLANVVVTNPTAQTGTLTNGFLYSSTNWLGGAAQSSNTYTSGGIPTSGSGDGMLNSTLGLAIDPSDFIYIMDQTGHRVGKYSAITGAFVGWIGRILLPPTGGAAGCNGASPGIFTPGYCTGGTSQSGNGDGMMNQPSQSTIDVNGYLYVAELSNHRVSKFVASTGAFVGWVGRVNSTAGLGGGAGCSSTTTGNPTPAWCTGGTSQTGTGDAAFNNARAVAVDATGTYLYVGDRDNFRVHKYNAATGAFVGWIGRILTSPTGGAVGCNGAAVGTQTPGWCTGGTAQSGTGDGMMSNMRGLALDSTGTNLYVIDDNGRVQRFTSSNGAFTGWIGRIGSSPTGPAGPCVGATVGTFTPTWCTGGTAQTGTGDGMLGFAGGAGAKGIILDSPADTMYVADFGNSRVNRYTISTGAFTGWIGRVLTVPSGGTAGCSSTSVGAQTPGWCTGGTSQSGNGDGMINGSAGLAINAGRSYLYVADQNNSRVNRYDLATGAPSGALGGVLSVATSWIAAGTPKTGNTDGMLSGNTNSVTDGTSLYTVDTSNHRIIKSNLSTGAYVGWIGNIGTSPTGGDPGCNGATVGTFTPGWCTGGTAASGTGNGMLNTPKAIAVDSTGTYLYVTDSSNHRVSRYTASTGAFNGWVGNVASGACATAGNMTTGWCSAGTSQSRTGSQIGLRNPAGVAIDSTGTNLYVSDTTNHRVWKFTASTGAVVGYIGRISTAGGTCTPTGSAPNWCTGGTISSGTADGQFNTPIGLHIDSTGILYVADSANHRIQKINAGTGIAGGWFGRINGSPTGGQAGCNGAASGNFTPGWCTGGTAQSGTGDGMVNTPSGVVVDPSRTYIYVMDTANHRIMKYNYTTPTFVGWRGNTATVTTGGDTGCSTNPVGYFTPGWCTGGTGTSGSGNGMMSSPIGVSADATKVYIGDAGNNRVIRMDQ